MDAVPVREEKYLAVTSHFRHSMIDQDLPQLTSHSLQPLERQAAAAQLRTDDDEDRLRGVVDPDSTAPGRNRHPLLLPDLKLPQAHLSDPGYLGCLE